MLRQTLPPRIQRHWHTEPYAAVVLQGSYEEAGEAGRFRAVAGHVLIHAPFSSHQDHATLGTSVLNLALPSGSAGISSCRSLADVDVVVRLAERRIEDAVAFLAEATTAGPAPLVEEPDQLALHLASESPTPLAEWARARGVARQTAFRWFTQAYGVAPTRYRIEARARRAWQRIIAGGEPLASIAADLGFSDQAHLTREVRRVTGRPPGEWRRNMRAQNPGRREPRDQHQPATFVQDGGGHRRLG
jgi:AraC-like DNA-binding protein